MPVSSTRLSAPWEEIPARTGVSVKDLVYNYLKPTEKKGFGQSLSQMVQY